MRSNCLSSSQVTGEVDNESDIMAYFCAAQFVILEAEEIQTPASWTH